MDVSGRAKGWPWTSCSPRLGSLCPPKATSIVWRWALPPPSLELPLSGSESAFWKALECLGLCEEPEPWWEGVTGRHKEAPVGSRDIASLGTRRVRILTQCVRGHPTSSRDDAMKAWSIEPLRRAWPCRPPGSQHRRHITHLRSDHGAQATENQGTHSESFHW